MDTQEIIESYVDDVALRLPAKLRNDIGLELRALLGDELKAEAERVGRTPDEALAIEVVRRFGQPEEVAARYHRPRGFDLVEPEHAPLFVKLAAIGVGMQWVLTLPAVFRSSMAFADWWLGWGLWALWWPGLLIVYFSAAAWTRRRWPVDPVTRTRPWTHWIFWLPMDVDWHPKAADRTLWSTARINVPLAALLTIFFIDPAWFLGRLLPTGADVSWASYDSAFYRWLRWPLIVLMAARTALYALAAFRERLRIPTETLRGSLWIVFVALLYWAMFGWNIFASPLTNLGFKAWLFIFLFVNTVQIVAWLRRALRRVRVPKSLVGKL